MSLRVSLAVAVATLIAFAACTGPEPTPPEVELEYRDLLSELDLELPGAAVARLAVFRNLNATYEIAARAEAEIERFRSLAKGRYHAARELARQGDFDRAETILRDLANHLPDTPDGLSAARHLEADFEINRARWLASRQRWEESAEVARPVLERGVAPPEAEELETLLDGAALVEGARKMAAANETRSTCREVVLTLEMRRVEEGDYPPSFTLADLEASSPIDTQRIRRSLSAIEDYRRTDQGYAMVCVGADGTSRVRVVDGTMEGLPPGSGSSTP